MSPEKPTIEMIARLSGVSRGTVDRVINNRPNVRPEKAARVRRVAERLNYTPNLAARALAKKAARRRIGVLLPSWPGFFEEEIRRGIAAARGELSLAGVEVVVEECRSKLPDDFIAAIDLLLRHGVAGLAVCAINSPGIAHKLLRARDGGIPVVTFYSDIAGSGRACFVGQDPGRAGIIAAGLMEKMTLPGSRIVIAAGNIEFAGHRDRVDAFLDRWRGLGRSGEQCTLIQTFNDYDTTFRKIREAVARDDDVGGVYMANDSVPACVEAIGGLALSRRMRVVAHDLSPEHRELLLYGAVDFVIGQDIFHQGRRPLELLTELLDGIRPACDFETTGVHIITAESAAY